MRLHFEVDVRFVVHSSVERCLLHLGLHGQLVAVEGL